MPCEAARNASDQFAEYIRDNISGVRTPQRLGQLMLQGLEAAHQAVLAPSKFRLNLVASNGIESWDVGTTTMLAAVVVQMGKDAWELVCISVGDCKLFIYRDGAIIDVTAGNRGNLTDARDPGGRIGPQLSLGRPDLRNLALTSTPCRKDDLVFVVTDGVHDNFDPQQLGMSPRVLGVGADDWNAAESLFPVIAAKKKSEFMQTKMTEVITKYASTARVPIDPIAVTRALTQYSADLSQPSRLWMEENPGKKLPDDYVRFPGKMDHASVICTKINYVKAL